MHIVVGASLPDQDTGGPARRTGVGRRRGLRGDLHPPRRLLAVAGLSPDTDRQPTQLGINDSVAAMRAGRIDAFFWSGGLPTAG
ncbi:MAG: hypothetical protein ACRDRK_16565 [Pseudonocardia sp.]